MRRIYFDHSATMPVVKQVADEMYRFLTGDTFGNPSSQHYFGWIVKEAVKEAREKVAQSIKADPSEISIYQRQNGVGSTWPSTARPTPTGRKGNHIITSAVEHHAVLNTVKRTGKTGL